MRHFRMICTVVLGFVTTYGLWTFFGSVFLCSPVHFFWDQSAPGGTCLNRFAVWFTDAGVNIVEYLVILILPMPVIRRLSLPPRQQKALMLVFALGGL
jgi:hypothetical protein